MHPTTEEHLEAVRRLLDEVAAEPHLSESARASLDEAERRLRRVERSGAARLPFLVWDNQVSLVLLAELADIAPDLASAIPDVDDAAHHYEPDAHAVNKQLRELLARAINELPDDERSDTWRDRLAHHLRERIAADPSINRPKGLTK